jgi:fatty-acyl-CoA synthase
MKAFSIASRADIEHIESLPYAEFMAHTSVFDALVDATSRHPDRKALTFVEAADCPQTTRHWTAREFIADVRRAANMFRSLSGDDEPRVAMLLPAIPQAYFTLWGAEAAGVACPINYLLDAEHVADLIRASGANILVALGPNPDLDIWSRVPGLRAKCPGLRHVLAVGAAGGLEGAIDFDASLEARRGDSLDFVRDVGSQTLAALFHTGGTTGAPKLAQHTHGNQLHSAWSAAQMYAMDEHDVIINGFPMFHVAGSLVYGLSALLSSAEVVLPTLLGMRNASLVSRYWEVVECHSVTLLAAVPTVISTLLSVEPGGSSLASVRALLTGGSPLPPELANAFEQRHQIPVRNILGMTECAGVVSIEPALAARVPGSCGLRLPFTQVQAAVPTVSEQGVESPIVCAAGQPGVLRLRGPNVGPGYMDTRRNTGTFSVDGWLNTGDIGHVNAAGLVFVTGRAKDVIIRSGHNIEPGVIEEALMRHPDVQFAAAVGEPDEYAGEMPVAYVVLKPGATVSVTELADFVKPHIPERPAHPRRIDVLTTLPLTAVGKVYKPGLRLRAIERVIAERLDREGLSRQVRVQGRDGASGLSLVLTVQGGATIDAVDASVRAIMARFAIPWAWTP